MIARRAFTVLAGSALAGGLFAAGTAPAVAQVEDGIVLNILRECARINDATARLACFDNNIRSAGATARASVPGQMDTPSGGGAVADNRSAGGFGGESVRRVAPPRNDPPQVAAAQSSNGDTLSARVSRVDPREPGIYLLTLADGAQWQFADSVDRSYILPGNGDTVTISRASLGSYLMRFNQQAGVRVRRVR